MPHADYRPDPDHPLDPSPGRRDRARLQADEAASAEPPRKPHGDALLDGSGSHQGAPPEASTLDARPADARPRDA